MSEIMDDPRGYVYAIAFVSEFKDAVPVPSWAKEFGA
jgi:hypothetical protein